MKTTTAFIFSVFSVPLFAAGSVTVQGLLTAAEESTPVCRDANGKLANCTPTAGIAPSYLPPMLVDGDDNVLGMYMGMMPATDLQTQTLNDPYYEHESEIVTAENYRYSLTINNGRMQKRSFPLYFDQSNCEGNAFTEGPTDNPAEVDFYGLERGFIYLLRGNVHAYVGWDTPVPSTLPRYSYYESDGSCINPPSISLIDHPYPLTFNDPLTTGVPSLGTASNPFPLPVRIMRP